MWGSPVEVERQRRINVAVWAYAYEVLNDSLVDDGTFDQQCLLVDLTIDTGNKTLDNFFRKHFTPDTGLWVHKHPDKEGLRRVYQIKKEAAMFNKFGLGEQKLLAKKISDHLDAHTAEFYSEPVPRWHLGASLIGDDCARKLWYSFRWARKDTYIDAKGKDQKGRMMRLFNRGHKEEVRFVEWLRGMGFIIEEFEDSVAKKQFRISDVKGHYGGSLDGMVTFPESYGELPKMLLEFKTSGHKYFDKIKTDGVKLAKPTHYAQMCSYGKRYDLKYALYMCVNKDTDEIHYEIVELDFNVADKMTIKAANIIGSATPPPKISENSAYLACKFCNFSPICHGKEAYEKNCRSCVNATPVENGEWSCKFYGVIPREFVPHGCTMWQEAR